jgi:exopolysaccharide production protein ExoY
VAVAALSSGAEIKLRFVYAIERLAAALVLAAVSPLIFLLSVVIVILSRSGPLVRHTRVGWHGRPLRMLKLRTMWNRNSPPGRFQMIEDVFGPPPLPKHRPDDRVTSGFAAFCRRHSLDELPQFLHVARGEMSLVGPRPITRAELDEHYPGCVDEVLSLRPGMTGLWQIAGRNDLSYSARRRLDRIFVRRACLALYFLILIRSVTRVIDGRGAY